MDKITTAKIVTAKVNKASERYKVTVELMATVFETLEQDYNYTAEDLEKFSKRFTARLQQKKGQING